MKSCSGYLLKMESDRLNKIMETNKELIIDLPHFKNVVIPTNTPLTRLIQVSTGKKIFRFVPKESLINANRKMIDVTKTDTGMSSYYLFIKELENYTPKFKQDDIKSVVNWTRSNELTKRD